MILSKIMKLPLFFVLISFTTTLPSLFLMDWKILLRACLAKGSLEEFIIVISGVELKEIISSSALNPSFPLNTSIPSFYLEYLNSKTEMILMNSLSFSSISLFWVLRIPKMFSGD